MAFIPEDNVDSADETEHTVGLKSKLHHLSRPAVSRHNSGRSGISVGVTFPNGQGDRAGENTPLIPSQSRQSNAEHPPIYEDDSKPAYVRYPALVGFKTWQTLASNYVNFLLVFVPLGIIAGILQWNSTAIFILNFLAIIPLASLLSFATEELSAKLGQTLGGLLNATFGNAVELIVRLSLRSCWPVHTYEII